MHLWWTGTYLNMLQHLTCKEYAERQGCAMRVACCLRVLSSQVVQEAVELHAVMLVPARMDLAMSVRPRKRSQTAQVRSGCGGRKSFL